MYKTEHDKDMEMINEGCPNLTEEDVNIIAKEEGE